MGIIFTENLKYHLDTLSSPGYIAIIVDNISTCLVESIQNVEIKNLHKHKGIL